MKCLFIVNSLVGGGAEKVFVDMIRNLDKEKYQITVLSIDDIGVYKDAIKKEATYRTIIHHANAPVLLHYLLGGVSAVWAWMFRYLPSTLLYRMIIHEKYDIEVAYLEGMSTKLVAGSNNKGSKKYAWVHTDVLKNSWTEKQFKNEQEEKKCYQKINNVIAVSDSVKEAVQKKFSVNAHVMYNVLDDKFIRYIANKGDRFISKKAQITFVSVGSLWKIKGYMRLVKIFHHLIEDDYDIELHLIGTGEDECKLIAYVDENNLSDRIVFHGFQEAPYDLLISGDVYVCPSYAEGFSTSVTEALILGLPVITTECAGMRELLGDSEFGCITENSDSGLEEGIRDWLEHPEKIDYYRRKAAERGKFFSLEKRIVELENMFEEDMKYEK